MPVTICRMKTVRLPLPKTYHQLAESRGTACVAASRIGAPSPVRASSQRADGAKALHTGPDSVGSAPPRTWSWPFSIRYSYW